MSSEIYELMKRSDERAVVEKAHRRPRFVEDCVREMVRGVVERFRDLGDDAFVSARQENLETIHQHDVVAERFGLLGELRASSRGRARAAPRLDARLARRRAALRRSGLQPPAVANSHALHPTPTAASAAVTPRQIQTAHVARAQEAVAHRVDQVVDRVQVRDLLPRRRQRADRSRRRRRGTTAAGSRCSCTNADWSHDSA